MLFMLSKDSISSHSFVGFEKHCDDTNKYELILMKQFRKGLLQGQISVFKSIGKVVFIPAVMVFNGQIIPKNGTLVDV